MEESLEEALRNKAKELRDTLNDLKKKDFYLNVTKLRANLPFSKRCVICTLKLPCKHFKNVKEMPKKDLSTSVKPIEDSIDFSKFIPEFPSDSNKIGFTVNYRGREKKYHIDPHLRTTSLPNEKRFNLLLTIEAYREQKLQKEIKKLELAKQEEEKKLKEKYELEQIKKKYLEKQKEKLIKHKQEQDTKREQLKLYVEQENEKKKLKEKKLNQYYENQKKTLIAYYESKQSHTPNHLFGNDELFLDQTA
jgi:hypothetical protein